MKHQPLFKSAQYMPVCQSCKHCRSKTNTLDKFIDEYKNTFNFCQIKNKDMGLVDVRNSCIDFYPKGSYRKNYCECELCGKIESPNHMRVAVANHNNNIRYLACDECIEKDDGEILNVRRSRPWER